MNGFKRIPVDQSGCKGCAMLFKDSNGDITHCSLRKASERKCAVPLKPEERTEEKSVQFYIWEKEEA